MKAIKKVVFLAIAAVLLFVSCSKKSGADEGDAPVTIELWYGAAVTEAGPPPADWKVFQIIKEKLNIILVPTALPSNESDQDVKIQAAGASNTLPDLFMVRRDPWLNLLRASLIAP
ncbi:MAG: ABC transporter substrate-binding protein, partial [Treponema sp.]|nr:ABC transporter substrate-binding protein [Treponema sp.]